MGSQPKDQGVTITSNFKTPQDCENSANRSREEAFKLNSALSCRETDVIVPLYASVERQHLEHLSQAWAPYLQKYMKCPLLIQYLNTKVMASQTHKSCGKRHHHPGIFFLTLRRKDSDLTQAFRMVKGPTSIRLQRYHHHG